METNNLQKLRELKGLSQNELAKRAGISHAQLWRYERGQLMTENNIKKIAFALGVTCDLLLNYQGTRGAEQ